jgi:hypothetical protein
MLTNTSAIPLTFVWRLEEPAAADSPAGGAPAAGGANGGSSSAVKEFAVMPARGTVLPGGRQRIQFEFMPQSVQHYLLSAVMDQPGITEAAEAVRLRAECAVPVLSLLPQDGALDYEAAYLGFPYTASFALVNDSRLPAKFEVLPQEQASLCVATFAAEPTSGSVPPKGRATVQLTLRTGRLGRIQLPVYVRTLGSRAQPLQVVLNARCLGPRLEFAAATAGPARTRAPSVALRTQASSADAVAPSVPQAGSKAGTAASQDGSKTVAPTSTAREPAAAGPPAAGPAPALGAACSAAGGSSGPSDPAALVQPLSSPQPPPPPLNTEPSAKSVGAASQPGGGRRSRAAAAPSPAPSGSTRAGGRGRLSGLEPTPEPASPWHPSARLSFDKVAVLLPHTRELRIHNPTVIPAQAKLFIEGTNSVFQVRCGHVGVHRAAAIAASVVALYSRTALLTLVFLFESATDRSNRTTQST